MATREQWTAFKDALHGEFQRNNQDPTWNYEIDEQEMTVRLLDSSWIFLSPFVVHSMAHSSRSSWSRSAGGSARPTGRPGGSPAPGAVGHSLDGSSGGIAGVFSQIGTRQI
jgi:hypothetical protein